MDCILADLTPASGRQNHTTSPSAFTAFRQRRIRVHRIPSRASDDREAPLLPGGTGNILRLISVSVKAKYFSQKG
jgi:hypothetical protein